MPAHMTKMEQILEGTYNAKVENVSPKMTIFLNKLANLVSESRKQNDDLQTLTKKLDELKLQVLEEQTIYIDLIMEKSNDGASMLAIISIFKYSIRYWSDYSKTHEVQHRVSFWKRIRRALADAWGYVSAWTNNGDGSYSWDHGSALVNADCHSDQVYEN